MVRKLCEKALCISPPPPWYVKKIEFNEEAKKLDIYIDFKRGIKFNYFDKKLNKEFKELEIHDTVEKSWRHLNFFEHECYLYARVSRVKLPNGKVRLIKTPWESLSKGFTLLFESLLLQFCISMPINKVSKLIGVHNDKLWNMLNIYIEEVRLLEDFSEIRTIGIDETSRRKGHEYISLFVDLERRRTVFVSEGKDSSTKKKFTEDLQEHNGKVEDITQVSCDMSPAFIKGVSEELGSANITFDKFHILKIINEAVDRVRIEEYRENKILKGTRYIWLKNQNNLTEKQREKLKELTISNMNLKTVRAYNIRESYQEIYQSESKEEFITYLKKWYFWATHPRLKPIIQAAKTIKRHWDGVISWFETKINNGILEGLNSVIQAAKSKAKGYRTFRNYKIIVYLLTGKLNFSLLNSNLRID